VENINGKHPIYYHEEPMGTEQFNPKPGGNDLLNDSVFIQHIDALSNAVAHMSDIYEQLMRANWKYLDALLESTEAQRENTRVQNELIDMLKEEGEWLP